LAAQSHVGVSFENPEYTTNTNALGTLRILEAIVFLNLRNTKFYQASTSELFGKVQKKAFNENSSFHPKSPYGASKLFAHWITRIYRESYNLFASTGILFNHESPRRGETFVTKKITSFLAKIKKGYKEKLFLGNIYAQRDWGHAKDYVEMQWRILQQPKPDDFIIATGHTCSVKNFIMKCCEFLDIKIKWTGTGLNEKASLINNNGNKIRDIIFIDKSYFRPSEVDWLKGDSAKANKVLKFKPKYNLESLIKEMLEHELKSLDVK
jgi:GDPmannose 4,6-dehydratase